LSLQCLLFVNHPWCLKEQVESLKSIDHLLVLVQFSCFIKESDV